MTKRLIIGIRLYSIYTNVIYRAPDYTNIPEKVEQPPELLPRSDSVTNIPEEVEDDKHAEPTRLMHVNTP